MTGPRRFFRPLLTVCPALLGASALAAQGTLQPLVTTVAFESANQSVVEHESVSVVARLDFASVGTIVVDFAVSGTAILQESATAPGDFFIDANPDAETDSTDANPGVTFDPATRTGTLTFGPGTNRLALSISLLNDLIDEGEERKTIILTMTGASVAKLAESTVGPTVHTVYIADNDFGPATGNHTFERFFLDRTQIRVAESGTAEIVIRSNAPVAEDLFFPFELIFGSGEGAASAADLEEGEIVAGTGAAANSPVAIRAGSSSATISLDLFADLLVEGDESFTVRLLDAYTVDASGNPEDYFATAGIEATVIIVDDDPTTVSIDKSDLVEVFREAAVISEGNTFSVLVRLSAPVSEAVEIPFTLTGTAIRGVLGDEDADYVPSPDNDPDVLTIAAGATVGAITIRSIPDRVEDGDKTLTIALGTPRLATSGTMLDLLEDPAADLATSYTITILDDDPVYLGFGRLNPDFDPTDFNNSPRYLPKAEIHLDEASGIAEIPLYLSGPVPANVTFDLQIVGAGTTATILRNNLPLDEQDWDYAMSNVNLTQVDTTRNLAIVEGRESVNLQIRINDDEEPALPYSLLATYRDGGDLPEALARIEPVETVTLRISNVNTANSGVAIRPASEAIPTPSEITLYIHEQPDIDVSALFEPASLSPSEANWVEGGPPRNPLTGLHEVLYELRPIAGTVLDPEDFAGYRSLKVSLRTAIYDPAATEGNDPLQPSIIRNGAIVDFVPGGVTEYFQLVDASTFLRYPTGTDFITLVEGTPVRGDGTFAEENADILTRQRYVLQPVNFPVLDPDATNPRTAHFSLVDLGFALPPGNTTHESGLEVRGHPLDLTLEFTNGGRLDFPIERLDRSLREDAIKILISRNDVPARSRTGLRGSIQSFQPRDDGSLFLQVENDTLQPVQIEYLGEDGVWRVAQPGAIATDASQLRWIDVGPPKTYPHPREVDFRVYRIAN